MDLPDTTEPPALDDTRLDVEIHALALFLDRAATRFERLLDERDRRGRVQVALTQAAFAYMADRERLAGEVRA